MTYGQGVVLGLVQGVTEFLPISSSGHLILVPHVFGWPDQGLDIFMSLTGSQDLAGPRRLAFLLVMATIPAGLAGVVLDRLIEEHLRLPAVVAVSTIGGALLMLAADHGAAARRSPTSGEQNIGWGRALFVGCAQALALIPGTSRSGITITAGLFGGLDRPTAARFAFLLGLPITAGAGTLKALQLTKIGVPADERGPLALALLAAFASGWASVWFLVGYLKRNSLTPFVLYRLVLGLVLVALFVLK
jgi:undecaprenyl-diphosphatase